MATSWTEPMDAALRKAYEAGFSYAECATTINAEFRTSLSRNACIGRGARIKLTGNVPRPERSAPAKPKPRVQRERIRYSPECRRMVTIVESDPLAAVSRPELDAMSLHLSLDDLTKQTCRWPSGGENGVPITFCGCGAAAKLPYCAPHARIAYPILNMTDDAREQQRVRGLRLARESNRNRMVAA